MMSNNVGTDLNERDEYDTMFGEDALTVTCAGCGDDINPMDLSAREEANLTSGGYCPSCHR